jgi:signal transduction histidine kinase
MGRMDAKRHGRSGPVAPAGSASYDHPVMDTAGGKVPRVVAWAGLLTWLLVAAPTVATGTGSPRFVWWAAACAAFGAALRLALETRSTRWHGVALAVQSAAVVIMVALLCNGFEGALLAVVAAQLGAGRSARAGLPWLLAQTAAVAAAIAWHWSPRSALLLTPPFLGFQVFTFYAVRLAGREARARVAVAASEAELRRLYDQLAQRTRAEERLRLAQDLHDVLGHHLAAMSLNLEAAAHQTSGPALESVRTAQALARRLLRDVKAVARSLRDEEPVDLRVELERLASDLSEPRIHLDLAPQIEAGGGERSRALLRCAQEFVTNAMRHGRARNVWIELRSQDGALSLAARDDGCGAAEYVDGLGLTGMRRRLEELGGRLSVEAAPSAGFAVRATLPASRTR